MYYELVLELEDKKVELSGDKSIDDIVKEIDTLIVDSSEESEKHGD